MLSDSWAKIYTSSRHYSIKILPIVGLASCMDNNVFGLLGDSVRWRSWYYQESSGGGTFFAEKTAKVVVRCLRNDNCEFIGMDFNCFSHSSYLKEKLGVRRHIKFDGNQTFRKTTLIHLATPYKSNTIYMHAAKTFRPHLFVTITFTCVH